MYDPIYSQNVGLCGFRCRCAFPDGAACRKVVPTYRGIVMHCRRVHGVVAQMEMFGAPAPTAKRKTDGKTKKPSDRPDAVAVRRADAENAAAGGAVERSGSLFGEDR